MKLIVRVEWGPVVAEMESVLDRQHKIKVSDNRQW
jgi:hypothetical protein